MQVILSLPYRRGGVVHLFALSALFLWLAGCSASSGTKGGVSREPRKSEGPGREKDPTQQSVSGNMEPATVQKVVRERFPVFAECYKLGLAKNPDLEGRISIAFVIDEAGNVPNARVASTTMPDQDVVECVRKAFETFHFPKPESGTASIVYPILMAPGE